MTQNRIASDCQYFYIPNHGTRIFKQKSNPCQGHNYLELNIIIVKGFKD